MPPEVPPRCCVVIEVVVPVLLRVFEKVVFPIRFAYVVVE